MVTSTKQDFDNEYSAFEWEEMERDADRAWYDCAESGVMDEDREDLYFVGNKDKFHQIEEQVERMNQQRQQKKGGNVK